MKYNLKNKFITCECCGFLAIIKKLDAHDNLICPFCYRAKCEHGGEFIEIDRETFLKDVGEQ